MSGDGHVQVTDMGLPASVEIYDTTLRDGSQQEGISLSVEDKLRVARQLDHLGVSYIEGGWPGANPKDIEFFARAAAGELVLDTATLVAFGSTRRAGAKAHEDDTLRQLVNSGTSAVCIVAKASWQHVAQALRTTGDEAIAMVRDSVEFLVGAGLKVFLDAEHFFDGFRDDADFSLSILDAAQVAGADALVLCDTNGGTLPDEAERIVSEVRKRTSVTLGAHFHNDSGCAVAGTLAAVRAGATQVQGCVNGYGERAGNADLCATIPNLSLKMGIETIGRERIKLITPVARHVAEIVNVGLDPQAPYVGTAVFAHKAGLHTSAIARRPDAYEHVTPDAVGNGTRVVVSEMAGRSTLALKAIELGLELDGQATNKILDSLKELEHGGYHFEVADGSLELLMRAAAGHDDRYFGVESYSVTTDWLTELESASQIPLVDSSLVHPWSNPGVLTTKASVKIRVGEQSITASAFGNGPINALDAALRQAIGEAFPALAAVHLTDYRVRVINTGLGTGAVTRVLVDSADADGEWSTIGVSQNVIESSWQALVDALLFGLVRAGRSGGDL